MHRHHRGAEDVDPILISNPAQEAIPRAAVVGPVADTDQSLAAVLQLLPSRKNLDLFRVKFEIRLPVVEHIAHIRRNVLKRQTQSVGVDELDIAGEIPGRPHLQPAVNTRQLVQLLVSGGVVDRRLALTASPQLHVQCRPLRHAVPLQWLHLALHQGVVNIVCSGLLRQRSVSQEQAPHQSGKTLQPPLCNCCHCFESLLEKLTYHGSVYPSLLSFSVGEIVEEYRNSTISDASDRVNPSNG